MIRKTIVYFGGLAVAAVIFWVVLFLSAWVVSPGRYQEPVQYTPEYIDAVKHSRETILDHEHPPVF